MYITEEHSTQLSTQNYNNLSTKNQNENSDNAILKYLNSCNFYVKFARNLSANKPITNVNVAIERQKILSSLLGSCYDDILK